jgi:hypothetical protein
MIPAITNKTVAINEAIAPIEAKPMVAKNAPIAPKNAPILPKIPAPVAVLLAAVPTAAPTAPRAPKAVGFRSLFEFKN